jgi:hypothetical protein
MPRNVSKIRATVTLSRFAFLRIALSGAKGLTVNSAKRPRILLKMQIRRSFAPLRMTRYVNLLTPSQAGLWTRQRDNNRKARSVLGGSPTYTALASPERSICSILTSLPLIQNTNLRKWEALTDKMKY